MTASITGALTVVQLPAHLIRPRDYTRSINAGKVSLIAKSIREIGLLSPIMVTPGKLYRNGLEVDGWEILAGQHRFRAMQTDLNWREIPCIVYEGDDLHLELVQIDENLARQELSDAQRASQFCRRKEIYEALHPETAHGTPGVSRQFGDTQQRSKSERFTKATSDATGQSERSIQRAVARGEALGGDIERVQGTSLDKAIELDALAKMPESERAPLIERARAGQAVSARRSVAGPTGESERKKKWVAQGLSWWEAGSPQWREQFLLKVGERP